jgi:hypothetical protein
VEFVEQGREQAVVCRPGAVVEAQDNRTVPVEKCRLILKSLISYEKQAELRHKIMHFNSSSQIIGAMII